MASHSIVVRYFCQYFKTIYSLSEMKNHSIIKVWYITWEPRISYIIVIFQFQLTYCSVFLKPTPLALVRHIMSNYSQIRKCSLEGLWVSSMMCLPCRVEVLQQEVWNECGHNDGQRGGESFEDVVCIFNDHRYDQPTQSLHAESFKLLQTVYTEFIWWHFDECKNERNIMIKPARQQLCRWWCCNPETFPIL